MSESELHKSLVHGLISLLRPRRSGSWLLFLDSEHNPEAYRCSPQIGSACPDVYARENLINHLVIGEAKTACDLENAHTEGQLREYFSHLAEQESGELIMAVPMFCAGTAHRLCRVARMKAAQKVVPFEIIGWMFGAKPMHEVWRG